MWEGYLNAIEEFIEASKAVKADLVADRFHVAKQYRNCVDTVRKRECKRLRSQMDAKAYETATKRIHWVLRRNHRSLDEDDKQRLRELFKVTPDLHRAYTLREELTAIFELPLSVWQAKRRLLGWAYKATKIADDCFKSFVNLLRSHLDVIANYFRRRANSGFVEGLNTKLKLITRRSYGLKRGDSLFQRLWLDTVGHAHFGG